MTARAGLGRAFAAAVGDWPAAPKRAAAEAVPDEPGDVRAPGVPAESARGPRMTAGERVANRDMGPSAGSGAVTG